MNDSQDSDGVYLYRLPQLVEYPSIIDFGPKRKIYGRSVDVRTEPKIKRDDPCPCGSGFKSKKCCHK